MKKLLSFFMLMMCIVAYGQDAYNSIATAYVTTTISQNVVFNSTMQQGGTFNFSVLAHNGGGRPGESDTANVRIQFFNSANQQLGAAVQSSYSNNLPNPNGTPGNPWTDPSVPWTTLSVSSTNCGGSCANVAYAKISMTGIDGSYWAGDYGPWYRAPTFTFNNGANLAYNPEFGPYNGVTAQGWTSSPGFGACQGAWGGSNTCIVNSSGQPGTSTTGLVANQNGGGPSATGGTTSGQAGGYNNTMSTSSPTGAPPPTGPTVTGTSTSNEVGSSSSTGSTETTSNTYQWSGGTYSVVGTSTPTTVTTTTTPVTTTTYSDGSTTTSRGTPATTSNTTYAYTVTGPPTVPVSPNLGTNKNSIYITQVNFGASNSITADQSGHGNYESVSLGGSNNIVRLGQGYTFSTSGVATESNISNYNLSAVTVSGNFNGIVNSQVGAGNSAIMSSSGTYNSSLATQTGNNNQVYSTISGNNKSLYFGQNGNSNIASVNLYGNNNTATVTQTGNNHGTVLNLINAGGANNVSVVQTGIGDAYSLFQTCTNPAGCSVSVIRNK